MRLTAAQRKSLQRRRDRALGWTEMTVRVSASQIEAVRAFVANLPPPPAPVNPDQLSLLAELDAELGRGESGQGALGL